MPVRWPPNWAEPQKKLPSVHSTQRHIFASNCYFNGFGNLKQAAEQFALKSDMENVQKTFDEKDSGKYGCETKAVRVPAHLVDDVQAFAMKKIKAETAKK